MRHPLAPSELRKVTVCRPAAHWIDCSGEVVAVVFVFPLPLQGVGDRADVCSFVSELQLSSVAIHRFGHQGTGVMQIQHASGGVLDCQKLAAEVEIFPAVVDKAKNGARCIPRQRHLHRAIDCLINVAGGAEETFRLLSSMRTGLPVTSSVSSRAPQPQLQPRPNAVCRVTALL